MYPNILRRLISYKITENIFSIDEKTKILIYFFENHLKSLKNMTRPLNDWVQDNLINPAALTSCLPLELLKKYTKI